MIGIVEDYDAPTERITIEPAIGFTSSRTVFSNST
jgi:hypothetical protein